MTQQTVVEIVRQTMMTTFWVALPLLAVGFVVGVVMSLVQILTSMQDAAFATIPRLVAFFAAMLIVLPWMLMRLLAFTTSLLGDLGRYAR